MALLNLGLSPCPNDTFIFHALLHGIVKPKWNEEIQIKPYLADVEDLNKKTLAGELPVSKVSLGVVPYILDNYVLLSSGGALGWGCGPLIISAKDDIDPQTATVAIPGRYTTANLLLDLNGSFRGPRVEMLFSEIMPAVREGKADIGVIIHEGRFTYQNYDLSKILDLGEWWESQFHLPLPLGAIVARRDLDPGLALAMQEAIAKSLSYAWQNPQDSRDFIHNHAQELNAEVTRAHIGTFVTDYSLNLGHNGQEAIRHLLKAALAEDNGSVRQIFLEQ